MSHSTTVPEPYRVIYSTRVRERLLQLAEKSSNRGDGQQFIDAMLEFHRRLRIYPQFGDPMNDLQHETGQVWIGIIRPLSMRYVVLDEQRVVWVAAMPVLLPMK